MDVIAICLACRLATQLAVPLPTPGISAALEAVRQGLEQPAQWRVPPGQSAPLAFVQNHFSSAMPLRWNVAPKFAPKLVADTSVGDFSVPFWFRWWQLFIAKVGALFGSVGQSAAVSATAEQGVAKQGTPSRAGRADLSQVVYASREVGSGRNSGSNNVASAEDVQISGAQRFDDWSGDGNQFNDVGLGEPLQLPPLAERQLDHVVSPDIKPLNLASTALLDRQPTLDPKDFQPAAGTTFNADGTVTLRVLVGNTREQLTVIGDFNSWGNDVDLSAYQLAPSIDPTIHEVTLPVGDYHKAQYRLRDQDGRERLDMSAPLFSTPAFNTRFYGQRADDNLNAVFWKPDPIPEAELASAPDLRGQQLVIAETDLVSLAQRWTCSIAGSRFYGQTGAQNIDQLYSFIAESGLPQRLAELGYNAIQFMPLDTHVDFWDPEAFDFPDWRYSYTTINFYGKHADFGSPDELKRMINAFHHSDVAVLLDVVYSHYSDSGNNPPREYYPLGFSQYHRADGWELYGGPWTRWGTRRFTYTPEVRRNLVDAALVNILDYGFDGLRVDNINGISRQENGNEFLRELTEAVALYRPQAVVIGEGYFGDAYMNRSPSMGGAGFLTTYSDRFYLWFTENIIKYRDEIDTQRLDYMLSHDWPLMLLYYPGNHDEFANPGSPFQTRGRYLAEAIQGGEHSRKIQSWSALAMFASSYYLDMVQLWTQQPGNMNDNPLIDWSKFEEPYVAEMARFQSDMKHFYIDQPAFAPYNAHRHMLRWVDNENKVAVFEKIDFATGQRVYSVVNLGDRAIEHYKIPVAPDGASFRMALDSDRPEYGGQERNSEWLTSDNKELEFFLGSYGVVGLVQQDKFEPTPEAPYDVEPDLDRPTGDWYYGCNPYDCGPYESVALASE